MLIEDVLKEILEDPRKIYSNGYNTVEYVEPYEIKIKNNDGNSINVIMNNWHYLKNK